MLRCPPTVGQPRRPERPAAEQHRERVWEWGIVGLALGYFCLRVVYFATHIDGYVPPDEVTHFGRSVVFSKSFLFPERSAITDELGLSAGEPFLYHLVMGKLLLLGLPGVSELVFLRLLNLPLGVATVLYGYRWMRLVTDDAMMRALFVVLMTNTLMFTAMSAAVSYDNMANLCAAAAVYYMSWFFVTRRPEVLAAFAASLLAGSLTKTSFLPFAGILLAIVAAREWRRLPSLAQQLTASLTPVRWSSLAVYGFAGALLMGNLAFYGSNLVRYRKLLPTLDEVIGVEGALSNRIFARNHLYRELRDGRITYPDAVRIASQIKHPGDRSATLQLLGRAKDRARVEQSLVGPASYAKKWLQLMIGGMYGYIGHRTIVKREVECYPYYAILTVASILFVYRRAWAAAGGHLANAAVTVVSYALVLLWLVNYPVYRDTGWLVLGVQGRYLFPVLVPLYGIVAYGVLAGSPRAFQAMIAVLVAGCFIYGDYPFFASRVTSAWFLGSAG